MATSKLNKRASAAVAVAIAGAMLITGTLAWTSLGQGARNEAIVDINPGGRLHDDFNGSNKDVYVENFGDDTYGVPIYARIRLDQYMEIGEEAGMKEITADRKAVPLEAGADINDSKTWSTFIPGEDGLIDEESAFAEYWKWSWGNDSTDNRYYMPTFNKNKDSLLADINGTYEGTDKEDEEYFDDYTKYGKNSSKTEIATYDHDSDTDEDYDKVTEDKDLPWNEADVYRIEEVHQAQKISYTAEVMTMEEWKEKGCQPGPYWVYDVDGWAYWAQAILPGETTGMLLDGITMTEKPEENWYYGINVVGQFVTQSDMSAFIMNGETITDDALILLGAASETENGIDIFGDDTIGAGESGEYTAAVTYAGVPANTQPAFTWTVGDAEGKSISGVTVNNGLLTVNESVPIGTEVHLKATEVLLAEEEAEPRTITKKVTVVKSYKDWSIQPVDAGDAALNYFDDLVTFISEGNETIVWSADSEEIVLTESTKDGVPAVTVGFSEDIKNGIIKPTQRIYTLTAADAGDQTQSVSYDIVYQVRDITVSDSDGTRVEEEYQVSDSQFDKEKYFRVEETAFISWEVQHNGQPIDVEVDEYNRLTWSFAENGAGTYIVTVYYDNGTDVGITKSFQFMKTAD